MDQKTILGNTEKISLMKKLLILVGIIIIVIISALVIGILNLGSIIKSAVNTYGPQLTQTTVRVEDVNVFLITGEALLKDFCLGNPEGFTSPEAMAVGTIHMKMDKASLANDIIIIDKIEVVRPIITYEKWKGKNNFKAIRDNIKRRSAPGAHTPEAAAEGAGKKLVIKDFLVKEGKVNITSAGRAGMKTASAQLAELHLRNLGGTTGGTPAEIVEEILRVLSKKVGALAWSDMVNQGFRERSSLLDEVRKELESAPEKTR